MSVISLQALMIDLRNASVARVEDNAESVLRKEIEDRREHGDASASKGPALRPLCATVRMMNMSAGGIN